jgi:hypothetical protein
MSDTQLRARDGDVLVVSYPEVKIPLATKFSNIVVGGLIYTRKLIEGDDAQLEYERIYAFLKAMAEKDAREKVRLWTEELSAKRESDAETKVVPPKPDTAASLRATQPVRIMRAAPPALPPKPAGRP